MWAVGINPTGLDWRRFRLAVDAKGEIIACGQVKPHRDGSRELASIAVWPTQRGKGAARAIIECLLRENPPPLYLNCRASLQPFYEKFGFRVLTPDQMPTYFRRIWRAFAFISRLFPRREGLLVMGLLAGEEAEPGRG